MERFTLTIELGNDAMRTCRHLARALRAVADRVEHEALATVYERDHAIIDPNGNKVGTYTLVEVQGSMPKLLKEKYKTYEGAHKRAAFENGVAPGEFKRGDKAHLYRYTVIKQDDTWRVQRERRTELCPASHK